MTGKGEDAAEACFGERWTEAFSGGRRLKFSAEGGASLAGRKRIWRLEKEKKLREGG